MQLPLKITIRDIDKTDAIETKIIKKAEKLQQFYDRIINCRVVVEATQKNKHQGKAFLVSIEVDVPNQVLIVDHNSHRNEDLYVAIRDSFNAMYKQIKDYAEIMRGNTKTHPQPLNGVIVRLFADYGFIETPDGNEYYFHETNVLQPPFSELEEGRSVRFTENTAGDSLQAHHITTI